MSDKYLHRADAPFGEKVWKAIDDVVIAAAKSTLTARRLMPIEGPYGLGMKFYARADATTKKGAATPLTLIHGHFSMSARDVASFEENGLPLDLSDAAAAAVACARQEDEVILNGLKSAGVTGLLTSEGVQSLKLKAWDKVGAAADDIIQAATRLDEAGCHGPYALALAPKLYNLILRRYPQGGGTEIEHIRQVVADGIIKTPALASGGVLLASGRQYATIVLGQDIVTGFVGPAGGSYELLVSESVALRLSQPRAICVLR